MKNKNKVMGVVAIIFGVLVIFNPNLLSWLVGIYLIVAGAARFMG